MSKYLQQDWYRNAVFYSHDVESFFDFNGDGVGDFNGLIIMKAPHDASSLLNWIEKLITTKTQCSEIRYGNIDILKSPNNSILFHAFKWSNEKLYLLHNFSPEKQNSNRKKFLPECELFEVLSDVETNEDTKEDILINGYGYR